MTLNNYVSAVKLINNSAFTTLFSGAGISVESGIPPFRGKGGIWEKYDTKYLDIDFFRKEPKESWEAVKEIFYNYSLNVFPNKAHYFFSRLENRQMLNSVLTQNVDNLHQRAGSFNVIELHGTIIRTVCISCRIKIDFEESVFYDLPPKCTNCGGYMKPDFIFFGEPLPEKAFSIAIEDSKKSELQIIVGTSGEVFPASRIPFFAKEAGAKIIEINPVKSNYTSTITDIFLKGKSSDVCIKLEKMIFNSD